MTLFIFFISMIFDRFLIDIIVKYLAINHSANTAELFAVVSVCRDPVSLVHFYKIIGDLCDRHLLVKRKTKIFLNMGRVVHYLSLAKDLELYDYTLENLCDLPIGKTKSFVGKSLYEMGSLYGNLYLKIIEGSGKKIIYHYQSHLYQSDAIAERGDQFWSSIEEMGVYNYFCCAGDTFLDHREISSISHYQNINIVHQTLDVFPREGYMMVIIGDWIIDCFLPHGLAQDFSFFYQKVTEEGLLAQEDFFSLFQRKEKITITVHHNPGRAKSLQSLLKKHCFPPALLR